VDIGEEQNRDSNLDDFLADLSLAPRQELFVEDLEAILGLQILER
jgi:hypothetical protein